MIRKTEIVNIIDESYNQYLKCWDILSSIKTSKIDDEERFINGILDFQIILANCIFALEKKYRDIINEKNTTIGKKSDYQYDWFKNRLKVLSSYQKFIISTINIGRALGDAYAWFFYQRELSYLNKHLEHKRISNMPTGIGGIGEIEFLKNTRVLENHLVLYHGITNILRLGDFSFIDFKNLELDGIGEIKTSLNEDYLNIHMEFIGPVRNKQRMFSVKNQQKVKKDRNPLPNFFRDRLVKQVKEIKNSFDSYFTKPDKSLNLFNGMPVDRFNKLTCLSELTIQCQVITDGLLCVSFHNKAKNLSTRIMVDKNFEKLLKNSNLNNEVLKIFDKESTDNSIVTGSILYSNEFVPHMTPGTVPVFWWPVDMVFLKKCILVKCLLRLYIILVI